MVAYAAVNSLLHTINLILNSSRLSLASSTREILESAHHRVESLQHTLENYDEIKNSSEGVLEQDARIREEVHRLQDAIESHFVSQSDELIHPHHLTQDIDRFVETTKTMEVGYIEELYKEEGEDDAAASSNSSSLVTDCGGNEFDDHHFLTASDVVFSGLVWVSGMAGIGKTALAKKLFHDEFVESISECRAFVRVGQKYKLEEILRAIIAQVDNNHGMIMEKDEGLDEYFKRVMEGRDYFIVFDDVWDDIDFNRHFQRKLPQKCSGTVLVTSRETSPNEPASMFFPYKMELLNQHYKKVSECRQTLPTEGNGSENTDRPFVGKTHRQIT